MNQCKITEDSIKAVISLLKLGYGKRKERLYQISSVEFHEVFAPRIHLAQKKDGFHLSL